MCILCTWAHGEPLDRGRIKMKTAYEILISAPEGQVTRAKIAYKAISAGQWEDASFALRNASMEEVGQWAKDAAVLADYCDLVCATN